MSASELGLAALIFLSVSVLLFVAVQGTRATLGRQRTVFTQETRRSLADMFIFADPAVLWRLNVAALFLVPLLVYLLVPSVPIVVVAALLVAIAPRYVLLYLKKRRFLRLHDQLPDTLLMMASALRGGANLGQTLEGLAKDMSPPMNQELSLVVREQRLGVPFEEAVSHLAERVRSQDFDLVVSALRINREVGGNLADTLQRLGETVRRRLMMEQKIRALTSQGKLQGIVMTALPVLIILALLRIEPAATGALFDTYRGWAVLAIAIVLEILGYWGIRKIVSIEV
ncbi:secretion system protein [Acidithiobacillus caldus]|jgi:tight adherence protein B|uniref:Type II secretion system protein n=1 Tax=Acidithiobacillus caldus (strain SM-1) TaxID=990288 RepID=F9ZTP7_ACICS|nr:MULTISPECIES: type II secretion system F family protein [Acidithiobacillus]AEK59394.1 type II secretion system protein [Acidithiobacillus caldus SM-1]AUW33767.1 secretion system protein [Acidithiobacillus caldus]MCE5420370.1 type II secretion system F family protein [Acidithiobacillus sp.]MCY0871510.1 type II secretion system F family protein [Acidithiobacillus caldus]QER44278.1 type II secretion system protein [Acidithiobacillus caldus]